MALQLWYWLCYQLCFSHHILHCPSFLSSPAKQFSRGSVSFLWGVLPLQVLGQGRTRGRPCFPASPLKGFSAAKTCTCSCSKVGGEATVGLHFKVTGLAASLSISYFPRWNSTNKLLAPPSPHTEPDCLVELGDWRMRKGNCHLTGPAGSLTWFSELPAAVKIKTRIQKNPLIWVCCWQQEQNSSLLDVPSTPGANTVLLPEGNCMSCPKATPLKGFIYKAVKHYWTECWISHHILDYSKRKTSIF